jgi:hypothetical protein
MRACTFKKSVVFGFATRIQSGQETFPVGMYTMISEEWLQF